MTLRRRLLLFAATAGVLYGLFWLPLGLAPLAFLAFVVALRGLRLAATSRDAVLFGLVFGGVRMAVGAHFYYALLSYSPLAVVLYLLTIGYGLSFAILEAWGAFWVERQAGIPRAFVFPLIYGVLEWARTRSDLSFCADLWAGAFGAQPQWLAWTPWAGPHVVSFLACSAAALLDLAIQRRRRPAQAAVLASAAAILWLAPPATDWLAGRDASSAGPRLRVGVVQPSVALEEKLDRRKWGELSARMVRLTQEAAQGADLVIWPETARPGPVYWDEGKPFSDPPMEALARRVGAPILYGCEIARVSGEKVVAMYNGAALARADGGPGDWYGKQQLLPFVEGVPFARLLGWDPAKARREKQEKPSYLTLMGNFSPGPSPTLFTVGPARIGVLICYEGMYPQLVRQYRLAGANVLCVMTNDGWWGRSAFPYWHARMVSARAREADIPVVRAANTGVSSVTDKRGEMGVRTELLDVTTLHATIEPSTTPPTFYERHGDLLVWTELVGLISLVGAGLFRRARSRGATVRV